MKVMVIDTVGGGAVFSRYYMDYFHGIDVVGYEPVSKMPMPHQHGYQCGYYAGVPLNLLPEDQERRLIFVRIFDERARPIKGAEKFMLEVIAQERPHVISKSWGLDDQDSAQGEMTGRVAYGEWVEEYRKLQAEIGFVDFSASGNSDTNDADGDVSFPQRLMPDICNIIGSAQRGGVPSRFSGDGTGVQCLFWGEDVPLCSNGYWQRGSGTSFACPKAAGLCAYLGLNTRLWRAYVEGHASHPAEWTGAIQHPKWGYGNLERQYQDMLGRLPANLLPLDAGFPATSGYAPIDWQDYRSLTTS